MKFLDKIKITASKPEKDLYSFDGSIDLQDGKKPKELKLINFLHRGSILKNSVKVDAVVLYTGVESKLAMNFQKPRTKHSQA